MIHSFSNIGHVHEYQPLFQGILAKLTVFNNLPIIFNSDQNSGKCTVWWLSKNTNFKHFSKNFDKSSAKAKIMPNVPGKEMIKNKPGLKFYETIKPLINFFRICCFKLELLGFKVQTVFEHFQSWKSQSLTFKFLIIYKCLQT